jgi:hypothetical protein
MKLILGCCQRGYFFEPSVFKNSDTTVHFFFSPDDDLEVLQVCRNGSPHLRGNVYVHYCTEESAMAAYNALNGRFYAGKQVHN